MPVDTVEVASSRGVFDAFTSLEIFNSILRSSEASFEVGDDGSHSSLSQAMEIGESFVVSVNGHRRITGRVEMQNIALDAARSSNFRFVVRTVLSDLEYADADPSIRVKNASIRDVVEQAVNRRPDRDPRANRTEIQYRADVSRQLITGVTPRGGKGGVVKPLKPLTEQQAAVQPGETVKQFLDRHLMRHGLMIWDSPDGKLVVGTPDDSQEALYHFRIFRHPEQAVWNNCRMVERSRDVTGVPSVLTVYGWQGGGDYRRSKVHAEVRNEDLIRAGFDRTVGIVDEGVKSKEQAERTVARAWAERTRKSDSLTVEVDGFSFHEASGPSPDYAPETVADLMLETQGGGVGAYYVESTMLRRTAQGGDVTQLQLTKQGTWVL